MPRPGFVLEVDRSTPPIIGRCRSMKIAVALMGGHVSRINPWLAGAATAGLRVQVRSERD